MMGGLGFVFRLLLTVIALVWLVGVWALVPYFNPEHSLEVSWVTVFFGTREPTGWVRDLLLLARAAFGVGVALYFFVPALAFFADFRVYMYRNTLVIVAAAVAVVAFLSALVVHQMYYI